MSRRILISILGLFFLTGATAALGQMMEESESASSLSVSEGVVATAVENLTPIGAGDTFGAEVGTLYAFTRINGAETETLVKHLWFHGDNLMAEIELPVRSVNWRTYSSKNVLPSWTGQWKVDVTDEDGNLLISIPFVIE